LPKPKAQSGTSLGPSFAWNAKLRAAFVRSSAVPALHSGWLISQLGRCTVSEKYFDFIHHQSTRQKRRKRNQDEKKRKIKTKQAAFPTPL
jgi:hypothetical protein